MIPLSSMRRFSYFLVINRRSISSNGSIAVTGGEGLRLGRKRPRSWSCGINQHHNNGLQGTSVRSFVLLGTGVSPDRLARNNDASTTISSTAINSGNGNGNGLEKHAGMTAQTRALVVELERGLEEGSCSTGRTTTNDPQQQQQQQQQHFAWKHRAALSQAITLMESRAAEKQVQASLLLTHLMRHHREKERFRIGIAGPVGAGKSTFVEALGHYILNLSASSTDNSAANDNETTPKNSDSLWTPNRLAVVCIDPSSQRTGGSILGDKTRMSQLAAHPRAYVRPAPAQGVLGGLAPRTDDVVRLLAQQYPLTVLETVGLGQSEMEVRESVDLLILAVPPGGGDQLQGVKKGIVEVADMIVVTKADGDLLVAAKHTAADYRNAMNFLHGVTAQLRDDDCQKGAATEVLLVSAKKGEGLDAVWNSICKFRQAQMKSGQLAKRRQDQGRYWMWKTLQTAVLEETEKDPLIRKAADQLLQQLDANDIPPRAAAAELLQYFMRIT